ncbi:Serine/threonine phosphatase stp [Aquisphaera giovannonii]|uniref:Serine/threonine phosphatase stp n=1 Tax=Aquisphaera giovannonii TaxID=406548 RepID=A0A5B9VY63_9BACT|nr:PP2C family serine/threonine-protein phosphatase [Aquisphaera giovannonii]QEH33248.1 Serine/threonine phosphatase stp [Aquisphaera giovannonii]
MSAAHVRPVADELDTGEFQASGIRDRVHAEVSFAGATHPGRIRERNEDQYLIAKLAKSMRICGSSLPEAETIKFSDEEGYLLMVADGMGGVAGGKEASTLAVRTVESFVLDAVKWFLHGDGHEQSALSAELRHALQRADRDILQKAEMEPRLHGMGTTLTVAYSVGDDMFIAHAGDSRAYLYRGGHLERMTSDHTLVQLLVDHGELSPEDAKEHPRRHVITNVVGGPSPGVQVDIQRRKLHDGDLVLLCSDGLTEEVPEPEIASALADCRDLNATVHRLIEATLARGAKDNVTVVVARYRIE